MLKIIRNSTIGIILTIIFGISLFLIKGGNRYSGVLGVGANDVAVVGEIDISGKKFIRSFDLTKQRFNKLTNSNLNNEESKMIGLDQQALSQLISEAIFLNEYNKQNIYLDDKIIAKKIKEYLPDIYDENNNIIDQNLNSFLYNQNLNLEEFVDIIKSEIKRNYYDDSLINNISYPQSTINKIQLYDNHKRNIEYINLPIKKLNFSISNNEEKIKKYYNENLELFKSQETRDIEYIYLNPNDFHSLFKVNENQINEYYNNNIHEFTEKEKRSFIQLNFSNKDIAQEVKLKLQNINDYKKIKNIAAKEKINFIEYKLINENDVLKGIAENTFKLNKNELSQVIASDIAYHLSFVNDILPEKINSFIDSKENIIFKIKEYKSTEYIHEIVQEIDEDILNNLSITEIANKHDIKISKLFKSSLNSKSNNNLINLIIERSFKEEENITSDINQGLINNSYFIFNVNKITLPKIINYEMIKDKVIEKWRDSLLNLKANDYINELKNNNITIYDLSQKYETSINKVSINKNSKDLPSSFINEIFNNPINNYSYINSNNSIYIGKVNSIKILGNELNLNNDNIDNELTNEIRNILMNAISNEFKIKINHDLINTLTSNI